MFFFEVSCAVDRKNKKIVAMDQAKLINFLHKEIEASQKKINHLEFKIKDFYSLYWPLLKIELQMEKIQKKIQNMDIEKILKDIDMNAYQKSRFIYIIHEDTSHLNSNELKILNKCFQQKYDSIPDNIIETFPQKTGAEFGLSLLKSLIPYNLAKANSFQDRPCFLTHLESYGFLKEEIIYSSCQFDSSNNVDVNDNQLESLSDIDFLYLLINNIDFLSYLNNSSLNYKPVFIEKNSFIYFIENLKRDHKNLKNNAINRLIETTAYHYMRLKAFLSSEKTTIDYSKLSEEQIETYVQEAKKDSYMSIIKLSDINPLKFFNRHPYSIKNATKEKLQSEMNLLNLYEIFKDEILRYFEKQKDLLNEYKDYINDKDWIRQKTEEINNIIEQILQKSVKDLQSLNTNDSKDFIKLYITSINKLYKNFNLSINQCIELEVIKNKTNYCSIIYYILCVLSMGVLFAFGISKSNKKFKQIKNIDSMV
jgi:hypothetical protein